MGAQTVPSRLRQGLPPGVTLADKTGTGTTVDGRIAAYNDIGLLRWPNGHVVAIAALLMDSPAPEDAREKLFADVAREVAAALGSAK